MYAQTEVYQGILAEVMIFIELNIKTIDIQDCDESEVRALVAKIGRATLP